MELNVQYIVFWKIMLLGVGFFFILMDFGDRAILDEIFLPKPEALIHFFLCVQESAGEVHR